MKKPITIILAFALTGSIHAQSIKDLDFLIGRWKVTETLYPGTEKQWQENGTRECEYYLDGQFIKCESSTVDSRNQKTRTYVYFMNYDKKCDCFRVTSLAHDFPLHGQHEWYLDRENKRVLAISPVNVTRDRFFRGTISFENPNRLVWKGWASIYKNDMEWTQIFEDVVDKLPNK